MIGYGSLYEKEYQGGFNCFHIEIILIQAAEYAFLPAKIQLVWLVCIFRPE